MGTRVLSDHDSSAAPQTAQIASPLCGIKNFSSVRLYSAPQLHWTIVAIPGICAWDRGFAAASANKNMAPSTTLGGQLPARAEKPHPGGHTGSEAERTDLRVHTAEAARSDFRPFAAPVLMMLDAEVGSTVWADVAMALMLDLRLPDVVFAAAAVRMMPALSSIFPVIWTNCCERNFRPR